MNSAVALLLGLFCASGIRAQSDTPIDPATITIVRDGFGVPHIFGPTDASVAYGLAWANAEDAFDIVQETLLTGKGMMGLHKGLNGGREGAVRDYLLNAFGIPGIVQQKYESTFSPEFKRYLEGYCQGVNAYARKFPSEVLVPEAFPISPKDLVQANLFTAAFLAYAHQEVKDIFDGAFELDGEPTGSNAYAFSSDRTEDGKTYLAINPHYPLEGSFSFYEAHIHSEEGLNMHGAVFHGGASLGLGNNENLGWGLTFNKLDLVDVYRLEMHPTRKNRYRLDGEWVKLEQERLWLSVRFHDYFTVRIPRKLYWSAFGPTFEKDGSFYAVRFGSLDNIMLPEQMYRMNKARNYEEFHSALEMRGLPRFNIVYADREDNILFLCNGQIPKRIEGPNWREAVIGNSRDLRWDEFLSLDSLPQVLNPEAGFVFNTNNTPFNCTAEGENPDLLNTRRYPAHAYYQPYDNNRSIRFLELVDGQQRFDYEAFKRIKFDTQFPACSNFMVSVDPLFSLDTMRYPQLAHSLGVLRNWDLNAHPESEAATLFALTIDRLFSEYDYGYEEFFSGFEAPASKFADALEAAQDHLHKYFDQVEVPLKEFQRLVRGDKDMPLPGYFGVLAANYARPSDGNDDGRYRAQIGDAYTQFVVFSESGVEQMETLSPYGASSRRGDAHFNDQMELFVGHRTKPMSLDRETVFAGADRIYHPGSPDRSPESASAP